MPGAGWPWRPAMGSFCAVAMDTWVPSRRIICCGIFDGIGAYLKVHGGPAPQCAVLRGSWRRRRGPPDERVDGGVGLEGGLVGPPWNAGYLQLVVLVGFHTTSIA